MSILIHDHSNIHQGGKIRSATADSSVGTDTSSGGSGAGITLPIAGGDVSLTDAGNYFTTDTAEAALQQLGAAAITTLDSLTDVVITSATTADRLRFDGSNWVNSALIWRPLTVYDPTTTNYLPLVDGSGNQLIAEA